MVDSLFDMPILGGISVGLGITIVGFLIRYIMIYQKETREEYSRRLTRAVIELEAQKTRNIELEYENERLRYLQNLPS